MPKAVRLKGWTFYLRTMSTTIRTASTAAPRSPPPVSSIKSDMIGPADTVSNLRPILRFKSGSESQLEKTLREKRLETEAWNQDFWAKHNSNFFKERQEYMTANIPKGSNQSTLTPDEMSVFYKSFLDKNWYTHINYNLQWYKRNFILLTLAVRVSIQSILKPKVKS